MRTIPKKVSILGEIIEIKQVSEESFKQYTAKGEEILGLALLLERKILILSTIPETQKKNVLAHEIFHFMLYQSGASQSISPEIEEVLCQTFSKLYFQLKNQGV